MSKNLATKNKEFAKKGKLRALTSNYMTFSNRVKNKRRMTQIFALRQKLD
jgi:hypothetical protein